jgi:syntaxin of plants SYP6
MSVDTCNTFMHGRKRVHSLMEVRANVCICMYMCVCSTDKEAQRRETLVSNLFAAKEDVETHLLRGPGHSGGKGDATLKSRAGLLGGPETGGSGAQDDLLVDRYAETGDDRLLDMQMGEMEQQDEELGLLGESIKRQKDIAVCMHDELTVQDRMLDETTTLMDQTNTRLKKENRHVKKVILNSKMAGGIGITFLLIMILVLLILYALKIIKF